MCVLYIYIYYKNNCEDIHKNIIIIILHAMPKGVNIFLFLSVQEYLPFGHQLKCSKRKENKGCLP